jgi:hypothetical protein
MYNSILGIGYGDGELEALDVYQVELDASVCTIKDLIKTKNIKIETRTTTSPTDSRHILRGFTIPVYTLRYTSTDVFIDAYGSFYDFSADFSSEYVDEKFYLRIYGHYDSSNPTNSKLYARLYVSHYGCITNNEDIFPENTTGWGIRYLAIEH